MKRLIINMAPRHTKSEFASFLFPAWFMGRDPKKKIIQATHTTELAVNFGRKTKNLIEADEFKEIFPEVKLAADSNEILIIVPKNISGPSKNKMPPRLGPMALPSARGMVIQPFARP